MMHLADWIVTAIAGPLMVMMFIGIYRMSGRLQHVEEMEKEIEERCGTVAGLSERMVQVESVLKFRGEVLRQSIIDNNVWHEKLDKKLDRIVERFDQRTQALQQSLLNEIRRVNGKIK